MAKIKRNKLSITDIYEITALCGMHYTASLRTADGFARPGLCGLLGDTEYEETLRLFRPMDNNQTFGVVPFWGLGLDFNSAEYWKLSVYNKAFWFNDMRETILLFIAAMHDEL